MLLKRQTGSVLIVPYAVRTRKKKCRCSTLLLIVCDFVFSLTPGYITLILFLTEMSLLVLFISPDKISIFGKAFEDFSCNMEDHLASQSFQQLSFFLDAEVPSEKVVFQPNTVLNKNMVS